MSSPSSDQESSANDLERLQAENAALEARNGSLTAALALLRTSATTAYRKEHALRLRAEQSAQTLDWTLVTAEEGLRLMALKIKELGEEKNRLEEEKRGLDAAVGRLRAGKRELEEMVGRVEEQLRRLRERNEKVERFLMAQR